jgi:hypothetical protein
MLGREKDLIAANIKLGTSYGEGYQKGKSEQLESDSKVAVPEPQDSLRRRAVKLANEVEKYVYERQVKSPTPGSDSVGATEEQKRQRNLFNSYNQDTGNACYDTFSSSWREVVQQLKARGIPTSKLSQS